MLFIDIIFGQCKYLRIEISSIVEISKPYICRFSSILIFFNDTNQFPQSLQQNTFRSKITVPKCIKLYTEMQSVNQLSSLEHA